MVPFSVNISITEKCPLKCPFCFQPYGEKAELDINTIYDYLDELSLLGTKYVQFSGGEPLTYKNLAKAIAYAKERGLRTRISTSGVLLTYQIAELLKDAGLDCCHISLNGSKECIHEKTRSGFNETIKALHILSDSQITASINWVANHENVHDLPNLITLGKTYNVKNITLLANKHNNKNKILYPLTFEDLCELKQYWVEYSDYLVIESCFYQLNNLIKSKKSKSIEHGCRAGRFYMAISARNEFLPCPHVNIPQKNIASIEEYWNYNEELNSMRQILKSNLQNGCQECISKENCSYCLCEMYGNSISNAYNCLLYQKKEG